MAHFNDRTAGALANRASAWTRPCPDGAAAILKFSDPTSFVDLHTRATQAEFDIEEAEIKEFTQKNADDELNFDSWPLRSKRPGAGYCQWTFVVSLGTGEALFPDPGERCKVRLRIPNRTLDGVEWCDCLRIDNPSDVELQNRDGTNFGTFHVMLPLESSCLLPTPLIPPTRSPNANELLSYSLNPRAKMKMNFRLRISKTTCKVELKALKDTPNVSPEAFLYLLGYQSKRKWEC